MAERTEITKQMCQHVKFLLAGGATAQTTARIVGIGEATVYRIKKANYDPEEYKRDRLAETNREKQRDKQPAENQLAEEQCPGQMRMELEAVPAEPVKQYRFQAAMVDRIVVEMDKINDTLSMILRAMRKE